MSTNTDIRGNIIGEYANVVTIIATVGNVGGIFMADGNVEILGYANASNVTATFGNVGGVFMADGNVTAQHFIGNGSELHGVTVSGIQSIDIRGNILGEYVNVSNVEAITGNIGNVRIVGGNVTAQHFIGNGSLLSDLTVSGIQSIDIRGNVLGEYANVSNVEATMGNIGNVRFVGGNVTAQHFIGNGSELHGVAVSGIQSIDIRGNVLGEYVNVGNVTSTSGNIGNVRIVRGNVTAQYFIGNGALLTGIRVSGNQSVDIRGNVLGEYVNVSNIEATVGNVGGVLMSENNINTSGQVDVLGNVVAGYFIGNGSLLTDVISTLPSMANIDITGNVIGTNANVGIITASSGNIGNVRVMRGNVTAQHFVGNGALLTGLRVSGNQSIDIRGNVLGKYVNAGNIETISGNIGGVLLSEGNIDMSGQVNVLGNVVAGYFIGNGALLTDVISTLPPVANVDITGNVIGTYANVSNLVATLGNIGNVRMVKGNVTAQYFVGNGALLTGVTSALPPIANIDIIGNINGTYANMRNITSTSGNIGNVRMAKGNVTAQHFIGNGSELRGVAVSGIQSIDIRGNVLGEYANIRNVEATTGNVGGVRLADGNIDMSGRVDVLGNVTAHHFIGNGALLTDVTVANIPAVYLSARRTTKQIIMSGSWAGRNIVMDSIQESYGISYDTTDGSFTLEGGVTYRVTAQLGWQGSDSYYAAFRLVNSITNEQVGPSAEPLGIDMYNSNGSSPILDVIFTPRETGYYCLKMATNVTAPPSSYVRYDVGTFMNIVVLSGRPSAALRGGWAKVSNWNFGGTITAPTPATTAEREYSWSVTGRILSMKGYYIATSNAGANAGEGEYLLKVPGGYRLHPSVVGTGAGCNTRKIPIGHLTVNTSSGVVFAHDATTMKFSTCVNGAGENVSSTLESLHADSYYLCFTIDVPIM